MTDFEAACVPHRTALYGLAMRYTRSSADAHDLVQDTLLRALRAWPRFVPGSNARAWLSRILTNAFINRWRKDQYHQSFLREREVDALQVLHGRLEDRDDDLRESLRDHLSEEMMAALGSLHEDQREIVERAYVRGERFKDIAIALGIPLGTVLSRSDRARRSLRMALSGRQAATHAESTEGVQADADGVDRVVLIG
jgi:RNA polymerase sigma-70 factor (ECF subfamily)